MPIDVAAEITINSPRETVSAFATNPGNDPVWVSGISQARLLTGLPFDQGAQVERVASFLGKRIEYVLEVVGWEPGFLMAMRSVKGPFPMEVAYGFDDAPGGTLARINVRGEAGGFFKLASPILVAGVKRNIAKDLKALKRLMEQQQD